MIALEDRQIVARNIQIGDPDGARLSPAWEVSGIDVHTLQRLQAHEGLTAGDGRPLAVRPMRMRAQILAVTNEPRFASVLASCIAGSRRPSNVQALTSQQSSQPQKSGFVALPQPRRRLHWPPTSALSCAGTIAATWPSSAALECAAWMREILR